MGNLVQIRLLCESLLNILQLKFTKHAESLINLSLSIACILEKVELSYKEYQCTIEIISIKALSENTVAILEMISFNFSHAY